MVESNECFDGINMMWIFDRYAMRLMFWSCLILYILSLGAYLPHSYLSEKSFLSDASNSPFFIFMCSYKHLSGLHADYNRKLSSVMQRRRALLQNYYSLMWFDGKCATHDKKLVVSHSLYIANNFCPSNEAIRIISQPEEKLFCCED